jgi:hypothetical protein
LEFERYFSPRGFASDVQIPAVISGRARASPWVNCPDCGNRFEDTHGDLSASNLLRTAGLPATEFFLTKEEGEKEK